MKAEDGREAAIEATHWVPTSNRRGSIYGKDVKSESDFMAEQHSGDWLTLGDACLQRVEARVCYFG
ncbi:hypothetical protein F2Q70_00017266 [Brassica cretica]|uniref:Uncharacterized protein n=1 Tax=Brassica cretica TaxID=69181 RepID=A0A3N6PYJ2_BRACR|nr:hypothetical protein F2Q70_00017266 [Brassica cretica]KAF2600381.1 hypothetical protein F2Q68_00010212 [Brassica cretica]